MQLDPYASIAKPIKTTLSVAVCADKIRKKYPTAYTDLNDATLIKKVLRSIQPIVTFQAILLVGNRP